MRLCTCERCGNQYECHRLGSKTHNIVCRVDYPYYKSCLKYCMECWIDGLLTSSLSHRLHIIRNLLKNKGARKTARECFNMSIIEFFNKIEKEIVVDEI